MSAPSDPPDLPDPSPELVLLRVVLVCLIAVMGEAKAARFLRLMAETLASEEAVSNILPIRAGSLAGLQTARRQSVAWFRQILPLLLGAIRR